jgi:hypothetical protein
VENFFGGEAIHEQIVENSPPNKAKKESFPQIPQPAVSTELWRVGKSFLIG